VPGPLAALELALRRGAHAARIAPGMRSSITLLLLSALPLFASEAPPPKTQPGATQPGKTVKTASRKLIARGARGKPVRAIQELLNRHRWNQGRPPLVVDGIFGPLTDLALRSFQRERGLSATGRVDSATHEALATVPAPREGRRAPTSTAPPPARRLPAGAASLERIQAAAVKSAREELARGVREDGGRNRGTRVDVYASTAGMPSGLAWCGFFASYNYTRAASRMGRGFAGRKVLHSVGKLRAFFLYRSYTKTWTDQRLARWEAARLKHQSQGSVRRYFVFAGSSGQAYARRKGLTCEVFSRFHELPIRSGDFVIWSRGSGQGHIGLVEHYDPRSGRLTTIEGNTSNRVRRKVYELSRARERAALDGFARPATGDFPPS
jgi:peptidoglycan hydrolase-like protein with peptidoglycan-binding domain